MAGPQKVIITCALTGSGHTPSMSPYLPYTVEDVVKQGVAAAEAGAAVLHLHARDPKDGSPSADPKIFAEYASGIRQRSDVVISISTGGGTGMSVQDRLAGVLELKPELCTLNLGTMNYGSFPMIDRYRGRFKFDWEEPYLESTRAEPFVSTYADIEYMLTEVGPATGTRFEAEAYDVSHLYTLAYYLDKGLVEPPILIQTIFGTMGGIGPDVDHIVHMKRTADRLLGDAYQWSTLAPAVTRWASSPPPPSWARTSGSAWKTASTWVRARLPSRTPTRSARSAASWRRCRWRSPPPPRPGRCWASRASPTSATERPCR